MTGRPQPLEGTIQHYAWGDPTFIPELLGLDPDGRPWAELWLGTHPNGPTTFTDGHPLGAVTGQLPFLIKVLAAAAPLSLQAHPSAEQAEAGHAAGTYPDAEPKPELLCALTTFEAFCGVRPVAATIELLHELGVDELADVLTTDGPGGALASIYRGAIATTPAIARCRKASRPEATWVTRLADRRPGDPSVVATLLLNLVTLQPGEALQLGPGNLHAYLGGAGIELMGPSDNVVRGGLTDKPIDVDDLLRIVDPTPLALPVLPPSSAYELVGTRTTLLRIGGPSTHRANGHELVITSSGRTLYLGDDVELEVGADETAYIATSGPPPAAVAS